MGDGDDLFTRGPADGNDRIEGGSGHRQISATGTRPTSRSRFRACWRARACCSGSRARPTRAASRPSPWHPFAGTDNVTVRDLSGTATTKVDVTLETADLRVDTVTVIGTQGDDSIKAATNGTTQTVSGLPATVNVHQPRARREGRDRRPRRRGHDRRHRPRPRQRPADPQGRRGQRHDHRLVRATTRSRAASASTSRSWAAAWTRSPGGRATATTSSRARAARTSCR